MKKDDVTKILKNCGLNATIGIKVLIEKSLVTSDGWTLEMHDLLQKMGRKIVSRESSNDIGSCSRLWSIEDIDHVLGYKRGTPFIQGIVLEPSSEAYEVYSDPEAFSNMCNLKLLMISNLNLFFGLTHLPNSLKVLAWDGYPLEALPLGKQNELVDLKMHHSKIIQPWNETQFFRKLKSIDLCYSKDLIQSPIVSGAPHLERLILEGCINLVEVHQSVGQHKKLVELNMKNCINLKIFPSKLEMGSLKDFILSGCLEVEKLPEFGENMKCLVMLDLKDCKSLLCLPSTISNLKSLEILNISGCSKFSRLPNNVDEEQPLEELDVCGTAIGDITSFNPIPMDMIFTTISHLPLLKELDLSYCNLSDGSIPYDLSGFSSLWFLSLRGNNFSYLPDNFVANHSKLRFLNLDNCTSLQKLPIVPQTLTRLVAHGCASLEPVFDPLQLWNFLSLDDKKMESSDLPRSVIAGSEIPPWFEYQNYVSLDREDYDLDSIISITVHIPYYYRLSEWWRIDLCFVLEYVTSDPSEETLASVNWVVLATDPSFPSYRDCVYTRTNYFHTPHLYITSLRGLQEQLRDDSNQLEIRIGTKTYVGRGRLKIRKGGCHVYCKDDVELWHRAKASIDYTSSTYTSNSSTSSTVRALSLPSALTSAETASDDAMNSRDTSLQPQFQMSSEYIIDNEKNNININIDDAMNYSRDISQPDHDLQMSNDEYIMDNEKENMCNPSDVRISQPIHPTTYHEDLQKLPLKSDDVINPSSSMPNASLSETSEIRLIRVCNKTCLCEQRAALKQIHAWLSILNVQKTMASAESSDGDHVVELIVRNSDASPTDAVAVAVADTATNEIDPLLTQAERPKINIFTVSYPRRRPRDEVTRLLETETSPLTQFMLWVWNGSRYSGLLCMTLSSIIYFLMEVLANSFSVQQIPLFETAFTRCTMILILSYVWLRRSEQPFFGTSNVRNILVTRALIGYLSLSSFIYCIQRLPFSQAILLNLTTPIMASIMARIFLHEKLNITDIAGIACSFFGVIFIFQQMLAEQGQLVKAEESSNANGKRILHIFNVLLGVFSSMTGGISYCLTRAGAKASDQPLATVFSFGLLASPASGICTFFFEDFVLPGLQSILLMLLIGVLAFFAEVLIARGLQLERTAKVANVLYMEVALSQLWGIAFLRVAPSFGPIIGCLLIFISVSCTMYIGPDKETDQP
ncbi:hypothetical protein L6164_031464 [Bauhinia variegata]|uniref:Uncharacterized protein n=1 Tax=Bauhinia variegata TaxID=167791 RepID=A0ACB9LH22_BAUVA|nr:hypothetical protein L6164_031464 [Bauhinia variegata]